MDSKKGVVHLLPLLLVALFVSGFVLTTTLNSFAEDKSGSVLSDEDEKDEEDRDDEHEDNSGSGNSEDRHEDENKDEEDDHDDDDDKNESESKVEVKIETRSNGVKTKTEVRGNEETTEVYVGGVKYKIEVRDGETTYKVETEEDDDESEDEVEEVSIRRFNVRNRTNFPLSVNTETDQLVISTPNGERTVFLPSIAIRNLIDNGLFDDVVLEDSTDSASIDESEFDIFEDDEGELVFEVDTVDNQRFLGMFNVLINKTVRFSAENGDVVSSQTPLLERILDIFSF